MRDGQGGASPREPDYKYHRLTIDGLTLCARLTMAMIANDGSNGVGTCDHTRRMIVQVGTALMCPSSVCLYAASDAPPLIISYELLTAVSTTLPHTLIGCDGIRRQLDEMRAQLERVRRNENQYGADSELAYRSQASSLQSAIKNAQVELDRAKTDLALAQIGIGIGLVLMTLGAVLTAEVAVGSLLALELFANAVQFSFQIIQSRDQSGGDLLIAYTKDRGFLFGQIIGQNSGSVIGKLIGSTFNVVSNLLSVWNIAKASSDANTAEAQLRAPLNELLGIQHTLESLGRNPRAWADAAKATLESALNSLTRFAEVTKSMDCKVIDVIEAPKRPTGFRATP